MLKQNCCSNRVCNNVVTVNIESVCDATGHTSECDPVRLISVYNIKVRFFEKEINEPILDTKIE